MKKHTLIPYLLIIFLCSAVFFPNCKKENSVRTGNNPHFQSYNWSAQEQDFFSLELRNIKNAVSRNTSKAKYHPLVVEAYNQIAAENEVSNFVDSVANRVGLPLWLNTSIHNSKESGETLLIIPMAKVNDREISCFLSCYKKEGEFGNKFIINSITRKSLLDSIPGDEHNKKSYAALMYNLQKQLFNNNDVDAQDAYCRYKTYINNNGGGGPELNPVDLPTYNPNCQWRYIQICSDTDDSSGATWVKGGTIPVHLDHDQDGVPNAEDQDWINLTKSGLTQEKYEQYVRDYWDDNMADRYGDYDDFWGSGEGDGYEFNGGSEADLSGFFDALQDMMDNIADAIGDLIDNVGDWFEDLFDGNGPDCPDWPVVGGSDDREIRCNWFSAFICDDNSQPWWSNIIDLVAYTPNDAYQGTEQARFCEHWQRYYSDLFLECDDFSDAIPNSTECDFFSPYYENCIDEKFMESYIPTAPPPDDRLSDIEKSFDNCFYTEEECPQCSFTVTLYIEQPIPGKRDLYGGDGGSKNGGHTFLSIKQAGGYADKIETFGWYPLTKPTGKEEVPGFFYHENEITVYNISVKYALTRAQFEIIKASLSNQYHMYYVEGNNCSTAAVNALIAAGISIPKTEREQLILGKIKVNPADLGEDLRANHPNAISLFFSPVHIHLTTNEFSTCN